MSEHRNPTALLSVAAVSFLLPLYALVRWFWVWDDALPREQVVARFYAGFPAGLRGGVTLELLAAFTCGVTALFAGLARRRLTGVPRYAVSVFIGLAILMGLWYLFTMM